jgi:hypothetical protein
MPSPSDDGPSPEQSPIDRNSSDSRSHNRRSSDRGSRNRRSCGRRRLLSVLGTTAVAASAGCSGRPPGGPESLSTELIQNDAERIAWQYPPTEDDTDGIGYVALDYRREITHDASPAAKFVLNTTVAEFSTVDSYNQYELDRFRARIRTPTEYQQEHGRVQMLVEPPGQWDGFHTAYERTGTHRELVVQLREVDTKGTIQIPFVVDSGPDPLPPALHCSFTVRAAKPGWLGKTIAVSDSGRLAFGSDADAES